MKTYTKNYLKRVLLLSSPFSAALLFALISIWYFGAQAGFAVFAAVLTTIAFGAVVWLIADLIHSEAKEYAKSKSKKVV